MRTRAKARKRVQTRSARANSTDQAIYNTAVDDARRLRKRYRARFHEDPRTFRALIKKAHAQVFRLRPGPKPDVRIAQAARERAAGKGWNEMYPRYIDGYQTMSLYTRGYAETGFRKKVGTYLLRHPRSTKKTGANNSTSNRNS